MEFGCPLSPFLLDFPSPLVRLIAHIWPISCRLNVRSFMHFKLRSHKRIPHNLEDLQNKPPPKWIAIRSSLEDVCNQIASPSFSLQFKVTYHRALSTTRPCLGFYLTILLFSNTLYLLFIKMPPVFQSHHSTLVDQ